MTFLALVAATIVVWIDVPRVTDNAGGDEVNEPVPAISLSLESINEQREYEEIAYARGWWYVVGMLVIWPAFWIEYAVRGRVLRQSVASFGRARLSYLWSAIVPPLRLCSPDPLVGNKVWLPWLGWQALDVRLQTRLERDFAFPMVGIALLILPVLVLQIFFKDQVIAYPWLRFALHFSTGLIWFAFAVEFIVMVSVADNKIRYCQRHWLDLVIILLPLISFLRSFRLLRMTRLAKVTKLPQVARFIRVYRLRGVTMRGIRALMILDIAHRVLRISPKRRLNGLRIRLAEKEREAAALREQIATLERKIQD